VRPLKVHLSSYHGYLQTRKQDQKTTIWDPVRRKFVALTPEEWVRQLLIQYLIQTCSVSRNRIAVEKQFKLYGQTRRFDLMLLDDALKPWLIAECKEPETVLNQSVFDQVFSYNLHFQVPYCLVTNGQHAYLLRLGAKKEDSAQEYDFIQDFPVHSD